jgi:hypothetical protein
LAAVKLRANIETYGNELIKQHIEPSISGPYQGLPDIPEARQAADGVAEIDALVLAGRGGEVRRYRDLTNTTWDQALEVVRGWRDLKRAQKLALFGWHPKGKAQPDETALRDHPMRDRFLDG